MHAIVCAANHTTGIRPCAHRDEHTPTCPGDPCRGCAPRAAEHGFVCRHHYEQIDDAFTAHRALARLLTLGDRAITPASNASTVAGPRIPLATLRLDLDAIRHLRQGSGCDTAATWVVTIPGAMQALRYARTVHAAARRHPTEPVTERLHRVRCAACRQVTVVTDPPALPGGDTTLRCVSCGWHTRDQDHAEAAGYTEALVRDPYRSRRSATAARTAPGGLEQLTGIAALARALR